MCGIAGCYPLDRYTRAILPHLAWDMEERGDDSWGITNGTSVYKSLGPITGGYKIPHTFQPGDAVTLHTRAASVGKVTLENQHPFVCHGTEKTIIGVHNGGVGNHKELAEYANKQLKVTDPNAPPFTYEVDSHALYMYLACGGPPNKVRGAGALVWWERPINSPTKVLNLLRFNTTALHIIKLDNGALMWCSLSDPLEKAARMIGLKIIYRYDLKGDNLYQIQPETVDNHPITSGYPLVDMGKMVFGGTVHTVPNRYTPTPTSTGTGNYWDDEWHSWHNSATSTRTTSTTSVKNSIVRISRYGEYTIHDTIMDYPKERELKQLIYGTANGYGLAKQCAICEGSYDKDKNPTNFVLPTRSDYVCSRCIEETWTETLEALAKGEVPLVLGISAAFSDVGDTPDIITRNIADPEQQQQEQEQPNVTTPTTPQTETTSAPTDKVEPVLVPTVG